MRGGDADALEPRTPLDCEPERRAQSESARNPTASFFVVAE